MDHKTLFSLPYWITKSEEMKNNIFILILQIICFISLAINLNRFYIKTKTIFLWSERSWLFHPPNVDRIEQQKKLRRVSQDEKVNNFYVGSKLQQFFFCFVSCSIWILKCSCYYEEMSWSWLYLEKSYGNYHYQCKMQWENIGVKKRH